MKLLISLFMILVSSNLYANAGERDAHGERGKEVVSSGMAESIRRDRRAEEGARNKLPPVSPEKGDGNIVSTPVVLPCPIQDVKTKLNGYCMNVICDSSVGMISALKLGGINVDSFDGACQGQIWKEVATRVEFTYQSFKMECDRMNQEYAGAIDEWKKKFDEMSAQKDSMKKKAIIGTAAGTAVGGGLGILGGKMIWDKKE
ncbi:MAG: hypothetical protein JXR30_01120 [Alphaproteobacteria bacterium]|nr:hypothetical protein [Alphaproteobacteria bacterium]